MVTEIKNAEDFDKNVTNSSGCALVDFFADWCGPCRMLSPVMEEISEDINNCSVFKVNVDGVPSAAERFGISSIPCVIAFRDGREINRHVGLCSKESILELID